VVSKSIQAPNLSPLFIAHIIKRALFKHYITHLCLDSTSLVCFHQREVSFNALVISLPWIAIMEPSVCCRPLDFISSLVHLLLNFNKPALLDVMLEQSVIHLQSQKGLGHQSNIQYRPH